MLHEGEAGVVRLDERAGAGWGDSGSREAQLGGRGADSSDLARTDSRREVDGEVPPHAADPSREDGARLLADAGRCAIRAAPIFAMLGPEEQSSGGLRGMAEAQKQQ